MVLSSTNPTGFGPSGRSKFRTTSDAKCIVGIVRMGNVIPICRPSGAVDPHVTNLLREFNIRGDVIAGSHMPSSNANVGPTPEYLPIRRLAMQIETGVMAGIQWVVFEPNTPTLWGQIRLNVGNFMQGLFIQGSFQVTTPDLAYFVKCDAENNPQSNQGVVNIVVGFAPLYPAEFVIISIQQITRK